MTTTLAVSCPPVRATPLIPDKRLRLVATGSERVDRPSAQDQQPTGAANPARAVKPEVLAAIGVCADPGCSPNDAPEGGNNPGLPVDRPGRFCDPCHGATIDGNGRVFQNKPAPTNLTIPPHRDAGETRIVIGEDAAA